MARDGWSRVTRRGVLIPQPGFPLLCRPATKRRNVAGSGWAVRATCDLVSEVAQKHTSSSKSHLSTKMHGTASANLNHQRRAEQ